VAAEQQPAHSRDAIDYTRLTLQWNSAQIAIAQAGSVVFRLVGSGIASCVTRHRLRKQTTPGPDKNSAARWP
jgi:hypothetical protein